MSVVILSLLLAVGPLWADQMTVDKHHDKTDIIVTSEIQMQHMKTHQDESDIPNERDPFVLADKLPVTSEEHLTREVFDKAATGCYYPFEPVGNNCYFFSDEQRTFDEALEYCKSLEHGHTYEVTLAMLDYGRSEDQALLLAATAKDNMFWVGGKTEDNVHWKWLDDRDIYLNAPFWYYNEPNEADNKCIVIQVYTYNNIIRSYLYDYNCDTSLNFICQTGFHFDFRRIGHHYYFISEELGLGHHTWQEARDFCQALSVPVGYHSDLAVLGLPEQDDYHLMMDLVGGYTYTYTWLGAFEEADCDFKWIDGRVFPLTSTYWRYDEPDCGGQQAVYLYHDTTLSRTYLMDIPETYSYPFICQMFMY